MTVTVPPSGRRPLLVTRDPMLLDDLVRIAATAGVELDVRADAGATRSAWVSAPAVLLGEDVAEAVGRAGFERRDDVVIIGIDLDDADIWERAVRVGAQHVVFLPDAEPWLAELLADLAEGRPEPAPLIAVVGGRGGAGATTLAAALGITAARLGRRALLVDADPLGGGVDLALGGEGVSGLRWPDLAATRGRVNGTALVEALPSVGDLRVLSWDRSDGVSIPPAAMDALLPAAQRGADLVIVDLPRRPDDAARVALDRASATLLVLPAEVRAAAAAARVAAVVAMHCDDVRVVVRGPAPGRLAAATIAESLGLPLAGSMRAEPGLAAALERGDPPAARGRGPLAGFCATFLGTLGVPARRQAA